MDVGSDLQSVQLRHQANEGPGQPRITLISLIEISQQSVAGDPNVFYSA
jgi:hypothetical protein